MSKRHVSILSRSHPGLSARKLLMGRSRHLLAGLLGLGVLFCGCATNRPGNPFAATDGKSGAAQAAKKKAGEDRIVADSKNPPRASSNEKTSLAASSSDG